MIEACAIAHLFPGPACVVSEMGAVSAVSPQGDVLAGAVRREAHGDSATSLLQLVRQCLRLNRPLGGRVNLPRDDDPAGGPRSFDVAVLPCLPTEGQARPVLLIGFETTLEQNLRKALISSRDLFRELVRCSADFAWETDENGVFDFVGGRGAMGYSADALHGRPSSSLIDVGRSPAYANEDQRTPFTATERIEDVEIWLRGAGGEAHCYLISAVPMRNPDGQWKGARGVGRDVTTLRLHEEELARARAREDLSRAVLDAMLSENNFNNMLGAAARALALTTKSDRSWVLCTEGDGAYDVGAAFGMIPYGARHFLPPDLARPVLDAKGPVGFSVDGWHYFGVATLLRGKVNGGICIARGPISEPFDEQDVRALLELVARHAAVAIAQATHMRALVDLTKSDELTGLANRRAYQERYARWAGSATGSAGFGAILYIDLDDFKKVNDLAGHAAGDALLRTFANLLHRDSRKRDLPIRLGGDEFAVFMEGIAPEHVQERAERLLRAAADIPLPEKAGGGNLRLSMGVATTRISDKEGPDAVLDRADKALYAAKREGKGRLAVAARSPQPGEKSAC